MLIFLYIIYVVVSFCVKAIWNLLLRNTTVTNADG